jgi:hypothetical protein
MLRALKIYASLFVGESTRLPRVTLLSKLSSISCNTIPTKLKRDASILWEGDVSYILERGKLALCLR